MDSDESDNPGTPVMDEHSGSNDEGKNSGNESRHSSRNSGSESDKGSSNESSDGEKNSDQSDNEDERKESKMSERNSGSEAGTPPHVNQERDEKTESGNESVHSGGSNSGSGSDSERENNKESDNGSAKSSGSGSGSGQDGSDSNSENKSRKKKFSKRKKIRSDSENDGEEGRNSSKNQSGSESEAEKQSNAESSDSGSDSDVPKKKRKRIIQSDSEQSNPSSPAPAENADENDAANKDEDDSDKDSNVGELIADIFGDSENEEDFEGFDDESVSKKKKSKDASTEKDEEGEKHSDKEPENDEETTEQPQTKQVEVEEESSDDDIRDNRGSSVSDFDLMMQKKKEEQGSRRKSKSNVDIINDNDDLIAELLGNMKVAAEEDCDLNRLKRAATKKLKLLPLMLSQVQKQDLMMSFLDHGILRVFTDWLSPLPDKSLPHIQIREAILKLLVEFSPIDQQLLKSSGIGRATMYLFKHPKESKTNRDRAGRLINEWSRPIFNLTTNFRAISKEEREQRDFDHMPKKRKTGIEDGNSSSGKDIDKALTGDNRALKPGDKGWIGRARVPLPSKRDYVVRPEWNVEGEISKQGSTKKQVTRLEKHVRAFAEKKRRNKNQRAVKISIEGNKMAL